MRSELKIGDDIMGYIKCPFCRHSDGNDDKILKQEVIYANNSDCQISIEKECDICGKKYEVIAEYKFSYEKLGYNEAEAINLF